MEHLLRNFSIYIVSWLDQYYPRSEIEKIKMRYGMEVVLDNVSKLIGFILISALLGCLKKTMILLLVFGLLRLFAGGVHMDSSLACFFVTGLIVVGGSVVSINYQADRLFFVFIMGILCILAYIYAPSGTIEHPVKPEDRMGAKYRTLFLMFIYGGVGFLASDLIMTLIMIGSTCEIITILPFVNTKYRQVE